MRSKVRGPRRPLHGLRGERIASNLAFPRTPCQLVPSTDLIDTTPIPITSIPGGFHRLQPCTMAHTIELAQS